MKILVVNNMAPFIWGGAEELALHLQRNLIEAGHQSEVMRIPFSWEPATRIPSQMLLVRALELWNVDRVIALKFPAYLIRHPHKTLWLQHQYRQAYDLLEAGQSNLPANELGETIRQSIVAADNLAFTESKSIFVNSDVTRNRLKKFNNFESEVLRHPLNDAEAFTGGVGQGYVFAGGRINHMKRQHLLVEAMAKTPKNVRLIVAGPPDGVEDARRLEELVEKHGLADRVKLDLRFMPRQEYVDYINNANAVAYMPFDEDSLGYVTMEAATASKPLISTLDSGGVLTLAKPAMTGWVTPPELDPLAEALTNACTNPTLAVEYGSAAKENWLQLGVTWQRTVERLLA